MGKSKCGEMEIFSRPCGYYRPYKKNGKDGYNLGKMSEMKDRKTYNVSGIKPKEPIKRQCSVCGNPVPHNDDPLCGECRKDIKDKLPI